MEHLDIRSDMVANDLSGLGFEGRLYPISAEAERNLLAIARSFRAKLRLYSRASASFVFSAAASLSAARASSSSIRFLSAKFPLMGIKREKALRVHCPLSDGPKPAVPSSSPCRLRQIVER